MRGRLFTVVSTIGLIAALGVAPVKQAQAEVETQSASPRKPGPGWWNASTVQHIRVADDWSVSIDSGYVYHGRRYWYAPIIYTNNTSSDQYFTCSGYSDPALSKEHIYRNGRYLGSVDAVRTYCSEDGSDYTLPAGQSFESWGIFPFVPRLRDRVVIEWADIGTGSPRVRMWNTKVSLRPAPEVTPLSGALP